MIYTSAFLLSLWTANKLMIFKEQRPAGDDPSVNVLLKVNRNWKNHNLKHLNSSKNQLRPNLPHQCPRLSQSLAFPNAKMTNLSSSAKNLWEPQLSRIKKLISSRVVRTCLKIWELRKQSNNPYSPRSINCIRSAQNSRLRIKTKCNNFCLIIRTSKTNTKVLCMVIKNSTKK